MHTCISTQRNTQQIQGLQLVYIAETVLYKFSEWTGTVEGMVSSG